MQDERLCIGLDWIPSRRCRPALDWIGFQAEGAGLHWIGLDSRGYSAVLVYEIAICNPSHIEERETFRAPDHTFTRRGSTVSALKPISPRGFALSIALHIPAANCAPARLNFPAMHPSQAR